MVRWHKLNYLYCVGFLLILASIVVRIYSYSVVSGDYTSSLSHWMDALRGSPGLTAFQKPFSDYTPLYLYLLKLVTLFPETAELFWIKTISLVFDVLIAIYGLLIIRQVLDRPYRKGEGVLAFGILFAIPTVILNSSLWGQCDSIYVSFILLAIYFMLRDKPLPTSIAFGVAISLKLQAVFFLPVLIGYLFARGWNKVTYLVVVPVIYVITIIPASLGGGVFSNLLFTYVMQAGEFSALTLSAPSIFAFFNQTMSPAAQTTAATLGYVVTLICVMAISLYAYTAFRLGRIKSILLLSLVSALALPYFLPHMHERYFYLADVLSVVYGIYRPRQWYIPIVIVASSFFAYMPFLSGAVSWFGWLIVPLWPFSLGLLVIVGITMFMASGLWPGQIIVQGREMEEVRE